MKAICSARNITGGVQRRRNITHHAKTRQSISSARSMGRFCVLVLMVRQIIRKGRGRINNLLAVNKQGGCMNQLSGNEMVSYNTTSSVDFGNQLSVNGTNFYDCMYHYYPTWYPTYHVCTEKSKIEQAFKIIGKLMEREIITKELTVKEFMKLVNDIAGVI
jgi:hypothetical protein